MMLNALFKIKGKNPMKEDNKKLINNGETLTLAAVADQTITWVLDATQLGAISKASWESPHSDDSQEHDSINLVTMSGTMTISLTNEVYALNNRHQIVVIGLYGNKKQFGTLSRNGDTRWSESGAHIPIDQQQLENLLKDPTIHLEHINFIKIDNYIDINYQGDAWYDVHKKNYLYTRNAVNKTRRNAAILDVNDSYACFYALHENLTLLDNINPDPLFWVTDVGSMEYYKYYLPLIISQFSNQTLKFKFTLLSGIKGPIFKEEYFISYGNEELANPLVSVGHAVAYNEKIKNQVFTWNLIFIENLDPLLYQKLKAKKRDSSVVNFNAFFYNAINDLLSESASEYNFSAHSTETISPAENVRLSFSDNKVLWYIHAKGVFIDGITDRDTQRQMIPIRHSGDYGYWITENTPVSLVAGDEQPLPKLRVYYQCKPQGNEEGELSHFIDVPEAITGFSQIGEFNYLSTREGVTYLLDQLGNPTIYAIENKFFYADDFMSRFMTLLSGKAKMPFIKLEKFFWHDKQNINKHEVSILFCVQNNYFYLLSKQEEMNTSLHVINDLDQLLSFNAPSQSLRVHDGMHSDVFRDKVKRNVDGTLYFDESVDAFLLIVELIRNVDNIKLLKDSILLEKSDIGKFSLSLQSDDRRYSYNLLSLDVNSVSDEAIKKYPEKIKLIKEQLTSDDDINTFHTYLVAPEVITLSANRGWYHIPEEKAFVLGNMITGKNSALVLGFDSKKDYLYACIDNKEIVLIEKQGPGAIKEKLFTASCALSVNNQLVIQPLDSESLSVAQLLSLSQIDQVRMMVLHPSEAGQVINSDSWKDVDIAISMPTTRSDVAKRVTINLTQPYLQGAFLQRIGNNLWIRHYGQRNGFCLFECFAQEQEPAANCQCDFKSDNNKLINQTNLIKFYSASKIEGNYLCYPKVPLKPLFYEDDNPPVLPENPVFYVAIVKPLSQDVTTYSAVDIAILTESHSDTKISTLEVGYTHNDTKLVTVIDTVAVNDVRLRWESKWAFPAGQIKLLAYATDENDIRKQDECHFTVQVPSGDSVVINSPLSGAEYNSDETVIIRVCFHAKPGATVSSIGFNINNSASTEVNDLHTAYLEHTFTLQTPAPMTMLDVAIYMVTSENDRTSANLQLYPKRGSSF